MPRCLSPEPPPPASWRRRLETSRQGVEESRVSCLDLCPCHANSPTGSADARREGCNPSEFPTANSVVLSSVAVVATFTSLEQML
ncbi:Os04g0464150 [Oryza sativa Japonica Group]|uniref:Os04g0464150 protein n=1 Tax=Oryza sativa subsp. japonica TaxID=39947 RepID=A0A0P0WB24_ORYSJ|nr:Os04g0464150 [Oryza sativa Japonica Group]